MIMAIWIQPQNFSTSNDLQYMVFVLSQLQLEFHAQSIVSSKSIAFNPYFGRLSDGYVFLSDPKYNCNPK